MILKSSRLPISKVLVVSMDARDWRSSSVAWPVFSKTPATCTLTVTSSIRPTQKVGYRGSTCNPEKTWEKACVKIKCDLLKHFYRLLPWSHMFFSDCFRLKWNRIFLKRGRSTAFAGYPTCQIYYGKGLCLLNNMTLFSKSDYFEFVFLHLYFSRSNTLILLSEFDYSESTLTLWS